MSSHRKPFRIIITIGLLSVQVCIACAIWHWYDLGAGLGFVACCGAGMIVSRLTFVEPTPEAKRSAFGLWIGHVGPRLHAAMNILTGHNLDHAICISLGGKSFFICPRCSGAVLGSLTGGFALAVGWIVTSNPLGLAICLALPLIIDWTIQTVGLHESTNSRRFLTGNLAGFGIVMLRGAGTSQLAIIILVFISTVYLVSFVLRSSARKKMRETRIIYENKSIMNSDRPMPISKRE